MERRTRSVYARISEWAAEVAGGKRELAGALAVPLSEVERWQAGEAIPRASSFFRMLDIATGKTKIRRDTCGRARSRARRLLPHKRDRIS
jgi:hypothetical protein